ncbi:hypothetical protein V5F77_15245 [Xanthobacter sp. DSM 24535]|uniref:hypothetical protein n=1 Tax=Roseixanthobacter psychrophilus TaxID=3119917 RepID=UPI00372B7B25
MSNPVSGLDGLARRLESSFAPRLAEQAVEDAARDLAARLAPALGRPADIRAQGASRLVGTDDPAAVARETGTLAKPAEPWLAPVLAELRRGRS